MRPQTASGGSSDSFLTFAVLPLPAGVVPLRSAADGLAGSSASLSARSILIEP